MSGPVDVLALADFAGMDQASVKEKIAEDFGIDISLLADCEIVVAYMSVGSYGCDSGAFIVFRKNGELYEVNGSHCSCHGFESKDYYGGNETQWEPERIESADAVVKREDWVLACGGYDDDRAANAAAIRAALARCGATP